MTKIKNNWETARSSSMAVVKGKERVLLGIRLRPSSARAGKKCKSPKREKRKSAIEVILLHFLRRNRDSNPGYPFGVYTLSRRAS